MTTKQINAPAGIWGAPGAGTAEQHIVQCFNSSGVVLNHGDVVVIDTSAAQMPAVVAGAPNGATGAVTTTTTAQDAKVLGVITIDGTPNSNGDTINPLDTCFVCIGGVARVNIGANAVAAGASLGTTVTAKQAGSVTAALGSNLGVALEAQTAKDAANTIRALIKTA